MEPRLFEIRAFMEEAREDLSTVDDMIKTAHYKRAVSRSYYAILNSAKAVLLTLGLSFSSHSGVLSAFNEHLVKTGKAAKELHKLYHEAFDNRTVADYQAGRQFLWEDADKSFRDAKEFVGAMESYLKNLGILPP